MYQQRVNSQRALIEAITWGMGYPVVLNPGSACAMAARSLLAPREEKRQSQRLKNGTRIEVPGE